MMERARLNDDADELATLQAWARMRYVVAPLPMGFVQRFGIPAAIAFQIVRMDGVPVAPAMLVISRDDALARVARLNAPGQADGFHRWN